MRTLRAIESCNLTLDTASATLDEPGFVKLIVVAVLMTEHWSLSFWMLLPGETFARSRIKIWYKTRVNEITISVRAVALKTSSAVNEPLLGMKSTEIMVTRITDETSDVIERTNLTSME